MKTMILLPAMAMVGCMTAAHAVPILKNPVLSVQDRQNVDALEKAFFESLEAKGTEATLRAYLTQADGRSAMTDDFTEQTRIVDDNCGTLREVQSGAERSAGTRFVQRRYVTAYDNCLIYWKLDYSRLSEKWVLNYFVFNTEERAI